MSTEEKKNIDIGDLLKRVTANMKGESLLDLPLTDNSSMSLGDIASMFGGTSPTGEKKEEATSKIVSAAAQLMTDIFFTPSVSRTPPPAPPAPPVPVVGDRTIPTPSEVGFIAPLDYVINCIRTHNWTEASSLTIERKPHPNRELNMDELKALLEKGWECEQFTTHLVIKPTAA